MPASKSTAATAARSGAHKPLSSTRTRAKQQTLFRLRRTEVTDELAKAVQRLMRAHANDTVAQRNGRIVLLIRQGRRISEVRDELGVSRPSIWRVLRALHESGAEAALLPPKKAGRPSKRAEVIEFMKGGRNEAEAAVHFGLHIRSVKRALEHASRASRPSAKSRSAKSAKVLTR